MVRSKIFIVAIFCFICSAAAGQHVKVKKETARIKGQNIEGTAIDLSGTEDEVSTSFLRYLKTLAKVKQTEGYYVLSEATITGNTYALPIYGLVRPRESMAQAWLGVNASEWTPEAAEKINQELEKVCYDFGLKFYRDKIQVQIDESVRALSAVERQQQRLVNEDKNLNAKLLDNTKQKEQLEKSLEANKVEHESLLKRLGKNKVDQDSLAVAAEQVKKIVELHRERQRKVN